MPLCHIVALHVVSLGPIALKKKKDWYKKKRPTKLTSIFPVLVENKSVVYYV